MKNSLVFWSLVVPVLVFTIWTYRVEKPCAVHVANNYCSAPLIPTLLASAVIEAPKPVNFQFNVRTRFRPINKSQLLSITHVDDLLQGCNTGPIVEYKQITVSILDDYRIADRNATGLTPQLNDEQLALLAEAEYSDNIMIHVDYIKKNSESGKTESLYRSPYLTVTPFKQAEYKPGNEALLSYFKENCRHELSEIRQQVLKNGMMYFTISKDGKLIDPHVSESCGYLMIDNKLRELAKKIPSDWIPAETRDGEKVDQKLVLSFGMLGC